MRRHWFLFASILLLGVAARKGKDQPPPPPAEPPPVEVAPAPPAEPAPPPEPPKPPPAVDNADFRITLTYADKTTRSGHVKRLERSADWFGEGEWSTEAGNLVLTLASGATEVSKPFTDIKAVTITQGKPSEDTDCSYDSEFTPWMYDCTLKTPTKVVTKDGKSWTTETRNKWRVTFDDDSQAEFWFAKYPVREQDSQTTAADENADENTQMYVDLQVRLRTEVKTAVVGIQVQ